MNCDSSKKFTLSCPDLEGGIQFKGTTSEFLSEKCKEHITNGKSQHVCAIDTISGESFTYSEFDQYSKNVASAFYKRGMRKGEIVVYMCHDIVKLHILFNGVWKANGLLRALYPEELEDSIIHTISEANAKWIVCSETEAQKCLSVAQKMQTPLEIIVMERNVQGCTSIYDLFQDDGKEVPNVVSCKNDPALMLNTSGTTGKCKGVVHTHKSFIRTVEKMIDTYNYCERNFFIGKATHGSAAMLAVSSLILGKTLLTISRISIDNVIHAFQKYKPGMTLGFPPYFISLAHDERMANVDKKDMKYIVLGGAVIPSTLEEELRKLFVNIVSFDSIYGMTESAPSVATCFKAKAGFPALKYNGNCYVFKQNVIAVAYLAEEAITMTFCLNTLDLPPGSIGKVVAGSSMQIRDEEGESVLGPNQEGELCVKEDTLFSYYHQHEKATEAAFTSDGWYRSGDYGYYDENGFLFLSGRQKEMFKCGGNHIFPATIDCIVQKHEAVADVCTIGVDAPEGGKMARAFVTLKPGMTATTQEIINFAHKNLPIYKHLRGGLYIVPSLPLGITGKVTRHLVAQINVPA